MFSPSPFHLFCGCINDFIVAKPLYSHIFKSLFQFQPEPFASSQVITPSQFLSFSLVQVDNDGSTIILHISTLGSVKASHLNSSSKLTVPQL